MASTVLQPWYQNSWALIIGINRYQYERPLSYACNDADAVAAALIKDLDFPRDNVTILKDNAATRQAIFDAYLSFADKASDRNDRVLVFFAGHGMTRPGQHDPIGYLFPVDGDPKRLSSLIRWDDLTRNAELIPAKHILFIMDACYSGLAMQRAIPSGTQRFISDMLQRTARQVLTAGKADEVVADGGGPQGRNSIFTGYLLEGLRETAFDKNGVLTANGLMHYVYQQVGQDNRSRQTPHYGHIDGDGDFVLRTPSAEHLRPGTQQDFLIETIIEVPEPTTSVAIPPPTFAQRNGYGDPAHPSFGRNDWSKMLGELRLRPSSGLDSPREVVRAFSWLSLTMEPTANRLPSINIAEKAAQFPGTTPASDKPYERFLIPHEKRTTSNSLVLYDTWWNENSDFWGHYLRFDETGNIEYAHTQRVFGEEEDKNARFFCYVRLIGITWQFIFWAKNLLISAGYTAGARLLVNLVGTRDTILAQFSDEPGEGGQKWVQPLYDPLGRGMTLRTSVKCHDPNLQMEYKLVIGNVTEASSRDVILDISRRLGLAYNHQSSPRCFNYNTDIFPWNQYFRSM